jgi:small subunit ribosomal protein S15
MLTKQEKEKIIKEFQLSETDRGSDVVQIAVLSKHIEIIQSHMAKSKKDVHSRRGLIQKVEDRRKFLAYLKKRDLDLYQKTIKKLGLRK